MIRLFKGNDGETINLEGDAWGRAIHAAIRPVFDDAIRQDVSLRDLTTLAIEEITLLAAEHRLDRGTKAYRAKQAAVERN